MSQLNLKPSQRASVVGVIAPISASSVQTSGWIDATVFHSYLALIQLGVLGASATVDAKLQQASDNSGTGAKDVTNKAITQFTKTNTDDGKQALINLRQEDLDFANGFKFFRLSITPAVAASLIGGVVMGMDPRYGAASDSANAATTQAQVVA
ncbi:hypothetical protein [Bradyrhizobium sp. BR 10261]|uniref:hypothetical protein n=1 Tax=Bradyrhizobium sp. BR 10261 TaxID=2749992 RepID=UPI001C654878|nr:hypothetical protein [Bradyrhizobium sp. BR 10261]MBW7967569.1 hypothetical protein [Bradyrhizobium sp. BR 10261]